MAKGCVKDDTRAKVQRKSEWKSWFWLRFPLMRNLVSFYRKSEEQNQVHDVKVTYLDQI